MQLPAQLAEPAAAMRRVFANPNLRRQQLALAGASLGEWSYVVALPVFAYRHGGAVAVGYTAAVRLMPSALVAPFAGVVGDRYDRRLVMVASDLARVVLLAAAAAAVWLGAGLAPVLAIAVLVSAAGTVFRPTEAAILPSLARTPEELSAANAASATIGSTSSFAGPALGGVVLALAGVGAVFAATALTFLWSASFLRGIRVERAAGPADAAAESAGIAAELLAGVRTVASDARVRLLSTIVALYFLALGALDVLVVVTALRLLHIGQAGVGYLNAAIGVGGVLGAMLAIARVGRARLALDLGVSLVAFAGGLALVGIVPGTAAAFVLLAVVGVATTVVEVALMTLMQRAVDDAVLARVFGLQEMLILVALGVGSLVTPAAVSTLGVRDALIGVGVALVVLMAVLWRPLLRIDRAVAAPSAELDLLRSVEIFAPLPPPALEQLAQALVPVQATAGEVVVRQGDPGDRFYVVGSGELAVDVDGRPSGRLGPGTFFGEIALLHERPRTATVTALTDVELHALEREPFLAAVTGHPQSAEAAAAVAGARLGSVRTAGA